MGNSKLEGEKVELSHENAGEGRSTSLAIDLWIKTYQNSPNFQIGPKYELGYFWWKFSKLGKKKICGWLELEIRGNSLL